MTIFLGKHLLREYLEKTEKKIYEILKSIFEKHKDIFADDDIIKADWSFFQKSYIITQQNIWGLIARNSTVSVGMNALNGHGALEILQTQLVEKCGEVSAEARNFKTKLETNEDLIFIRKTLAEAGIFNYIISKNNDNEFYNIDVRRFLSRSPEATESAKKLNALKENYLQNVLENNEYAEIRHLLVLTFTISGKKYKLNLGSQKIINEQGAEVKLTDRTGLEKGTIEFDTESYLGKKDSSARCLVAKADSISTTLSQLIYDGDKAQEQIIKSFDNVANSFFTGLLPADKINIFAKNRKEYIEKRKELRNKKEELKNIDKAQIANIQNLKNEIKALILNIRNDQPYSKFIPGVSQDFSI